MPVFGAHRAGIEAMARAAFPMPLRLRVRGYGQGRGGAGLKWLRMRRFRRGVWQESVSWAALQVLLFCQ